MGFCKTWLKDSSEVNTDGVCPISQKRVGGGGGWRGGVLIVTVNRPSLSI